MIILYILTGILLWLSLGWVSKCVRFGTWQKNPMISLLYSGLGGSLSLNGELITAQLSGPFVALKIVWLWWRHSVPIGFRRPTNQAFLELTRA